MDNVVVVPFGADTGGGSLAAQDVMKVGTQAEVREAVSPAPDQGNAAGLGGKQSSCGEVSLLTVRRQGRHKQDQGRQYRRLVHILTNLIIIGNLLAYFIKFATVY